MVRISAALLLLTAQAATADISVQFDEGAPTDRFTIANTGACARGPMEVVIDLTGSAGQLIFDVTDAGAGVQVFQPLRIVAGLERLTMVPEIQDGDQVVVLPISTLAPGETVAFTIDVDDTIGAREITVAGSEIVGATFSVDAEQATFGPDAAAVVAHAGCLS